MLVLCEFHTGGSSQTPTKGMKNRTLNLLMGSAKAHKEERQTQGWEEWWVVGIKGSLKTKQKGLWEVRKVIRRPGKVRKGANGFYKLFTITLFWKVCTY